MIPKPDNVDSGQFFCQDPAEFIPLLDLMRGSKSVLEIGSRYGESLRWFARQCPEAKIVSVDLGDCPDNNYGHRTGDWWDDVCAEISTTHEMHQIYGDSHNPEIIEKVKALGPYDFIFIDGDHSLYGVLQDWHNYGQMGKKVAFHDVALLPDVAAAFATARKGKTCILINHDGGYGIGVILQ